MTTEAIAISPTLFLKKRGDNEKSPQRIILKNKKCMSAARLGRGFQTRPTELV